MVRAPAGRRRRCQSSRPLPAPRRGPSCRRGTSSPTESPRRTPRSPSRRSGRRRKRQHLAAPAASTYAPSPERPCATPSPSRTGGESSPSCDPDVLLPPPARRRIRRTSSLPSSEMSTTRRSVRSTSMRIPTSDPRAGPAPISWSRSVSRALPSRETSCRSAVNGVRSNMRGRPDRSNAMRGVDAASSFVAGSQTSSPSGDHGELHQSGQRGPSTVLRVLRVDDGEDVTVVRNPFVEEDSTSHGRHARRQNPGRTLTPVGRWATSVADVHRPVGPPRGPFPRAPESGESHVAQDLAGRSAESGTTASVPRLVYRL